MEWVSQAIENKKDIAHVIWEHLATDSLHGFYVRWGVAQYTQAT